MGEGVDGKWCVLVFWWANCTNQSQLCAICQPLLCETSFASTLKRYTSMGKRTGSRYQMEKRNNNEQKKIDNVLYILGLSGTVICCVYLLISKITGFRIENYLYPCLFHTVTGYYCPGCGGTRAVCALFQGHFLISFLEHPFVPYAAVLCAWFLLSQTIERLSHHKLPLAMHYKDRYLWIGLAILIINCMVKNIVRLFWGISLL